MNTKRLFNFKGLSRHSFMLAAACLTAPAWAQNAGTQNGVSTLHCSVSWMARSTLQSNIQEVLGVNHPLTTDTAGQPIAHYSNMGFEYNVGQSAPAPGILRVDHWFEPQPPANPRAPDVMTTTGNLRWRIPIGTRYDIHNPKVTVTVPSVSQTAPFAPLTSTFSTSPILAWAFPIPPYTNITPAPTASPTGAGTWDVSVGASMGANTGIFLWFATAVPANTERSQPYVTTITVTGDYLRGNPGEAGTSPTCVYATNAAAEAFVVSSGATTDSVLTNDTSKDGLAALVGTGGNVTLTPGASPAAGLTMNPDGTISVAAGTAPGTYSYSYQICPTADPAPASAPAPSTCSTTTATVTVVALAPQADAFTVPAAGGTTSSVVANDQANGEPAVIGSNVTLTPGSMPAPSVGSITLNADGTITVAPGTALGTYEVPYQLCTLPATTPPTCTSLTAQLTVAGPALSGSDPSFTVPPAGGDTPSVLAGEQVDGAPAVAGSNVTLTPGAAPTPAAGSITMNADGTITVAPGTTPGTYSYPYEVCTLPATTPPTCVSRVASVTMGQPAAVTPVPTLGAWSLMLLGALLGGLGMVQHRRRA